MRRSIMMHAPYVCHFVRLSGQLWEMLTDSQTGYRGRNGIKTAPNLGWRIGLRIEGFEMAHTSPRKQNDA